MMLKNPEFRSGPERLSGDPSRYRIVSNRTGYTLMEIGHNNKRTINIVSDVNGEPIFFSADNNIQLIATGDHIVTAGKGPTQVYDRNLTLVGSTAPIKELCVDPATDRVYGMFAFDQDQITSIGEGRTGATLLATRKMFLAEIIVNSEPVRSNLLALNQDQEVIIQPVFGFEDFSYWNDSLLVKDGLVFFSNHSGVYCMDLEAERLGAIGPVRLTTEPMTIQDAKVIAGVGQIEVLFSNSNQIDNPDLYCYRGPVSSLPGGLSFEKNMKPETNEGISIKAQAQEAMFFGGGILIKIADYYQPPGLLGQIRRPSFGRHYVYIDENGQRTEIPEQFQKDPKKLIDALNRLRVNGR